MSEPNDADWALCHRVADDYVAGSAHYIAEYRDAAVKAERERVLARVAAYAATWARGDDALALKHGVLDLVAELRSGQ